MNKPEIHKILFLCGKYSSPSSANSICVQNMAECFHRKNHEVYVLSESYDYDGREDVVNGVKVKRIYGGAYERIINYFIGKNLICNFIFSIIQILRYMIVFWIFPRTSLIDSKKIFEEAKRIIEDNSIDLVVATTNPYDVIYSALMLKKQFGSKLKVITYHLDLLSNPNNNSRIVTRIKKKKAISAFAEELSIVDKMLLPQTAAKISSNKIVYVDFPLYVTDFKDSNIHIPDFLDDVINLTIAGSLDSKNRDPNYICEIIDKLPPINNRPVILNIWGKLSDIDVNCYKNVIYHGLAKVDEVPLILGKSDFLLNVGNALTYNMIPSKIFQMFAAKKPIIFGVSSERDKSVPYFKKYGYTCFVKCYEKDTKRDLFEVTNFIRNFYKKEVLVDDCLFEKSTPEYICNEILAE